MPTLHVSSLSKLQDTVTRVGASHVVTLINASTLVATPDGIRPERHLFLGMSDIVADLEGHILPGQDHVERFLAFVTAWERDAPLVIHCWAGISRSTAGAFIAACALAPHREEEDIARSLRGASPSATPNARLVAIADSLLGREGRMSAAIHGIGRGADAFECTPFALALA